MKELDSLNDRRRRTGAQTSGNKVDGVLPDADLGAAAKDSMFVHRKLADGDLYFVINRSKKPVKLDARFRVSGKAPEILSAVDGRSTPVSFRQDGATTVVPIEVGPEQSFHLLFRKPATTKETIVAKPALATVAELGGSWGVTFQPGRGAPPSATLPTLASLSAQSDPAIRYFSGEAIYRKTFSVPKGYRRGQPLWLDLGAVGDLAEVSVNGRVIGTAWQAPYRLDIGPAMRPGENRLEVKVANLWVNRLIGDAQPDAKKVTFVTIPTFGADAPLRPSGLIGPVRLEVER